MVIDSGFSQSSGGAGTGGHVPLSGETTCPSSSSSSSADHGVGGAEAPSGVAASQLCGAAGDDNPRYQDPGGHRLVLRGVIHPEEFSAFVDVLTQFACFEPTHASPDQLLDMLRP